MSEQTSVTSAIVPPSVDEAVAAFRNADRKARAAMIKGFRTRAVDSFMAGEASIAEAYKRIVEALSDPEAGANPDLEAAVRYVTHLAVTEALEASLSDGARAMIAAASVDDHLRARLEGVGTNRKSRSADGATRAGSSEPKGNIMGHIAAALETRPAGTWWSVDMLAKFESTGHGYTETFRPSTGAVSRALESNGAPSVAWRREMKLEVGTAPMGRNGRDVQAVRIRPSRAPKA